MKKLFSLTLLIILALNVSVFALNIHLIKSESKTIVVPDNYPTIQLAINHANNGDTIIVRDGTYLENVDVNKSLTIMSENGPSLTIVKAADSSDQVFMVTIDDVVISGFTVSNGRDGIGFSSSNSTVINCLVEGNSRYGIGLWKSNNVIINSTVNGNKLGGINIWALYNQVISSTIEDNQEYGIGLFGSGNGLIKQCVIKNDNCGISLGSSNSYVIYHNNFVDNPTQISSDGSANTWDNGFPSGGNYWSDYIYRYPNAAEIDSSGIWNTPYTITSTDKDNYPLMKQHIIPEFGPILTILALFMIATLLATVIQRKRAR